MLNESANRAAVAQRPTRARHIVLALIVAAYVITYMDRVNNSSATPVVQRALGLSAIAVGWIFSSFRWGYALFQIPGGWFGDKVGPRRALACIVCWWSLFTSFTALCWNATSLGLCRFLFGVGEAGAFPIATRSLSRWMPPEERGFSQGLPHAASRLGAAMTPPLVVLLMIRFGWRMPFFLFGFQIGMPPEERGFSQGLPHAASRLGAAMTPPLVVLLMIRFGWRMPFFLFGL